LVAMVEKLEAENQTLAKKNKAPEETKDTTELEPVKNTGDLEVAKEELINKVNQELSELEGKYSDLLKTTEEKDSKIKTLEDKVETLQVTQNNYESKVKEQKEEIKNLNDRLDAKRKALESSTSKPNGMPRKARKANAPVDSSSESESNDDSFDPKSKRTNQKNLDSSDTDEMIKIPKTKAKAPRKNPGKKSTAVPATLKNTANPRPDAKIPIGSTPEKLLTYHTSFLKRQSKGAIAELIEMQCYKLNKIGKQGTVSGQQHRSKLESLKKDDLVKICQTQERLVQENTEKNYRFHDTYDVKYFEKALEELHQPKYNIKKFYDAYEKKYSIHVDDYINDLTVLPKTKVKKQLFTALFTYWQMKSRNRFGQPCIHRPTLNKKCHDIVDKIFASEENEENDE
jgi:DNA repair exonuclease SbcCD ATPase subunit